MRGAWREQLGYSRTSWDSGSFRKAGGPGPATGQEMTYEELTARAQAAAPFSALVDPDDPSFLLLVTCLCAWRPSVPGLVRPLPPAVGAFVRCCLESLALKYRWTIDRLESILGTTIRTIHVVGGGSKNTLLCQFTADACGRPVHAGPVEATAIGNILMQAIGRKSSAQSLTFAPWSPVHSLLPSTNPRT